MNWGREALDLYEKNLNKVGKIEYRGEFPYTLLPTFHSAFFGVDLGGFTGSRRFVNQIPVNGIRKGGLQERVDFVNGRAG